jgi:hypothetical protein
MARRSPPTPDQWRKAYGVEKTMPTQEWQPVYNVFRDWWDQGMSPEELDYGMEYVGMPRLKNLMGQPLHPYFTDLPVEAPVETSGDPWVSGVEKALAMVAGQDGSGDEDLGFFTNQTDPWASGIDQALAIVAGQDESNLGGDYVAPEGSFDKSANVADLTDGYGSQGAGFRDEAEFDMGSGVPADDTGVEIGFDITADVINDPALLDGQPDEVLEFAEGAIVERLFEEGATDDEIDIVLEHVFGVGGETEEFDDGLGDGPVGESWQPTYNDDGSLDWDNLLGYLDELGENPGAPMDPAEADEVTASLEEVMADQMAVFDTQVAEETAAIDALVDAGLVDIDEAETLYNDTIDGIYNDFLDDQTAIQAAYEDMVAASATSRTADREALMAELGAAGIDPSLVAGDLAILDEVTGLTQDARGTYLDEVSRIGRMSDADRQAMSQGMFTGFRQDVKGAGRTEKAAVGREAREGKRALEAMGLSAGQMSEYLDLDPGALFASMVAGVDLPAIAEGRAERDWRTEEREAGQDWQSEEAQLGRDWQSLESERDRTHAEAMQEDSQSFSREMADLQNTWQGSQNDLNRELEKMRFFESIRQFNKDLLHRDKQFNQDRAEFGMEYALRSQALDDARREFSLGLSYDYYQTNTAMSQRDKDRNESIRQFDETVEQWQKEHNLDLTQQQWKEIYDQKMVDLEVERIGQNAEQFEVATAVGMWEFDQSMAQAAYEFTETLAANDWQFNASLAEDARQFGITTAGEARELGALADLLRPAGLGSKMGVAVDTYQTARHDHYIELAEAAGEGDWDGNDPGATPLRAMARSTLTESEILAYIMEDIAHGRTTADTNEFGISYQSTLGIGFSNDDLDQIEGVWDTWVEGTPVENWVPPTARVGEDWDSTEFDAEAYLDMIDPGGAAFSNLPLEDIRDMQNAQSHLVP